ncbi:radical SAM protein [Candidatus Dojkabacteria bacterium]|nr:radical SAM protein [Candidatus Dojkabacteria bacterium]
MCFNLTNTCNTRCRYCFQSAVNQRTEFLDKERIFEVLKFFDKRASLGKKYVQYTGGEIFMHPDIFEILRFSIDLGWTLRLQTNAMMIPFIEEKKMSFLRKCDVSTRVSLDGWNPETHEYFREKGSFEKVVKGIKTLQKYIKYIVVKCVVHKKNFFNLDKLFDFCLNLGVQGISTNVLRFEGYAREYLNEDDVISVDKLYKKLVILFNKQEYSHLIGGNDLVVHYIKGELKLPKKVFYVDYDGRVYPDQKCLKGELVGNLYDGKIEDIFNEGNLKETIMGEIPQKTLIYISKNLRKEVLERWKCWYMQEATK